MIKSPIDFYIDVLMTFTDINAYEKYNSNIKNEIKDISFFKRRIYAQDIIDVFNNNEGFTIITFIEDGKKKEIKVLEDCNIIKNFLENISSLNVNNEVKRFLIKKIKEKK